MNTDDHVQHTIKLLVQKYQPLHIISFGRHQIQQENSGCFITPSQTNHYQHFSLMVTESITRIEHEVQDYVNFHYNDGTIAILVYGKENVQEAMKNNSGFFITVYTSGQLLYSHDGMHDLGHVPVFDPSKAGEKAEQHLLHKGLIASGFLDAAGNCLDNEHYNICVFLLHQVVEQCTILLVRVFLSYRSEIHNLYRQLRLCNCFSPVPYNHFLGSNEEEKRLFDILVKSYSRARYGNTFDVDHLDADQLFNKVSAFLEVTKSMCEEKVLQLKGEEVAEGKPIL